MKPLLSAALMLPSMAMACGQLSDYEVVEVSFKNASVKEAVSTVVKGTPFQVIFSGGEIKRFINANSVSGPLDQVMSSLAAQAGFVYQKDRCVISVVPRSEYLLTLHAGDPLAEKLSVWLRARGYSLAWEAEDYHAELDITLDKNVEDTLEAVLAAMRINGVNLDATIYANHVVRIQEIK